ncbi:MAG: molybdopterin-dependent oxidoreductase [Deltaproteobacteria bacterium]
MPKVTIDGREIEVEDGLNLIQAASKAGVEIPHFCYHPALSVVAQCRQCLVDVEGVPKVMPACNTFVRDGLVVKTNTERAIAARKATVEFTLINHPLDCPICDKGGECPLQLTTFKHGPGHSRFDAPEEKKVRRKSYLSDKIMYDPNRCIMCTRCQRFTDEVTKTGELGTSGRGFRKKIVTFPGKSLDNELAGNVIDLCPVGALLSRETLHQERVWYWEFTDTICSLCSNGCNITAGVDPRKGGLARVRPRVNADVNKHWICDRGRYGFRDIQEARRLRDPILREGEGFALASWDKALAAISEGMRRYSPDSAAFLGSPSLTNEELYLLKKIATGMGVENLYSNAGICEGGKKFGIISSDPFPNSSGVRNLGFNTDTPELIKSIIAGKVKCLFIAGEDLLGLVPQGEGGKLAEAMGQLSFLAAVDFKLTETLRLAHAILPGASPYEKDGTFTNDEGRVQRIKKAIAPPGSAKPDWEILATLGNALLGWGINYKTPSEVMLEVAGGNPLFKGVNYDKVGMLGMRASPS